MNKNYDELIREWIDENREEIIKDWISICKTPAIKDIPCENAPFGKECAKALKECTDLFKNRGFDTEICENSGYSLVGYGEGEKTIGLFCHSDVVPVGEGWLYTEPFEPIVKDGALIGRGVEDNKSGIIASLCAMEFFRKYDIPLKSRIQLFIGSNEESGMEDIKAFAREKKMPDISLIPDAEFPCSTGEKGICQLYATANGQLTDIIDFCGGEAFNIVLDKVTVKIKRTEALENELLALKGENEAITISAKDDTIFVVARGIAKHASIPEGSINSAHLIAELLSKAENLCEGDRGIMKKAAHILSCPYGSALGIDYCDELFGRLTFVNGMARVENGRLKLSFDMRYSSLLDSDDLVQRTKKAFADLDWSACVEDNMAGFSIDADSEIPEIFEGIYKEITGFDKKSFKLGGGTYARNIKNAFSVGTFTEVQGETAPALKMPAGHGGAHQADEMIDIESFFAALRVIVQYIVAMDEEINK